MQSGSAPGIVAAEESTSLSSGPQFLIQLEPRGPALFRNFIDLLSGRDRVNSEFSFLGLSSAKGDFWQDVFVTTRLPWRHFLESALYHALGLAIVFSLPRLLPPTVHRAPARAFDAASVIYFSQDDYLPPLDTRPSRADLSAAQKGQPEYARQPILSVPPEADNPRQTIVTAPDVKLERDVEIPNVVAWTPRDVPVPIAATARNAADLHVPSMPVPIVAPAPEVSSATQRDLPAIASAAVAPAPQFDRAITRNAIGPVPSVIAPPPTVEPTSARHLGDINIGPSNVVAPAPELPTAEQRMASSALNGATPSATRAVVPPAPLVAAAESSPIAGRLIALGLRPAVLRAPVELPPGNRRGKFAATPEGTPGAPGTPDIHDEKSVIGAAAVHPGSGKPADLPSGLYVGPSDSPQTPVSQTNTASLQANQRVVDPRLVAKLTVPKLVPPRRPAQPGDDLQPSDLEKKVFGPRHFYSMTLNMPNLNSAGGSWVVHFAELNEDNAEGELVPPIATQKVDPAYPAELMRTRVEGTVTLYAVIHSDGSVGDVRVLAGNDERLSRFASSALARWHFRPATKHGNAVALEAVVTIPFRSVAKP